MTVRERLLEISELKNAERLKQMGDYELTAYVGILNSFVEEFPAQEANVKNALEKKDYPSLSKNLVTIKDMLVRIHADTLAEACLKQIKGLYVKHEKIETFLNYFLSVLTMFSIDIQMAILNKGYDRTVKKTKTGERSILAVDDSAFILGILRNILQGSGYKLTCVTSGKDALKFMQNNRPDLFILDIEMPKLDGYDLAKKIKESGHMAPVIFLTAYATKEYVIEAVNVGAVDFIVKPVDREQVLTRIAKYL